MMSTEESVGSKTIQPDTVVNARLLGAQRVKISSKRIVGRCHSTLHPGKLTRKIMEEHNCLGKKCVHFEKYEEAGYWQEFERKQQLKIAAKTQKAARRQQAAAEAEYFEELKVLFQSYADEAGYTMQIIRVQGVRASIFVYYVSDYPFADGNRFPVFLKSVRFFFPHHRIVLRHVMDQDGHFLTRKEYAQIKR